MSGIQQLSVKDRIEFVEAIWDSIAIEADKIPLTEQQRLELDKRFDRFSAEGSDGIRAQEAIAEIRVRL
jgi:putative addiction module component (TIGR02574 family)